MLKYLFQNFTTAGIPKGPGSLGKSKTILAHNWLKIFVNCQKADSFKIPVILNLVKCKGLKRNIMKSTDWEVIKAAKETGIPDPGFEISYQFPIKNQDHETGAFTSRNQDP